MRNKANCPLCPEMGADSERDGTLLRTDARNKANSWDPAGRLTLRGPIGYNDMRADGFFFERGDAAESRGSKGWREPS
jgi:hypothetical protein